MLNQSEEFDPGNPVDNLMAQAFESYVDKTVKDEARKFILNNLEKLSEPTPGMSRAQRRKLQRVNKKKLAKLERIK